MVRYLGEPDAINVAVLKEYAATFDFRDMSVDEALRLYVSGFRLPGESRCCAAFRLRPGVRLPVARRAAVAAAVGCHSLSSPSTGANLTGCCCAARRRVAEDRPRARAVLLRILRQQPALVPQVRSHLGPFPLRPVPT